ncbi:hypothetical protein MPH_10648 [Macrophomina phaseolina MS6]|uniref:Uncharacterized protein n=1 Tax=Macrophomina phaseolina (strain MS6) TaxID=1126212 RepID=K2QQP5_MACPH|nr:hypothetical protein MPH_10648 [Macrophomina phaseolina MS6]
MHCRIHKSAGQPVKQMFFFFFLQTCALAHGSLKAIQYSRGNVVWVIPLLLLHCLISVIALVRLRDQRRTETAQPAGFTTRGCAWRRLSRVNPHRKMGITSTSDDISWVCCAGECIDSR